MAKNTVKWKTTGRTRYTPCSHVRALDPIQRAGMAYCPECGRPVYQLERIPVCPYPDCGHHLDGRSKRPVCPGCGRKLEW